MNSQCFHPNSKLSYLSLISDDSLKSDGSDPISCVRHIWRSWSDADFATLLTSPLQSIWIPNVSIRTSFWSTLFASTSSVEKLIAYASSKPRTRKKHKLQGQHKITLLSVWHHENLAVRGVFGLSTTQKRRPKIVVRRISQSATPAMVFTKLARKIAFFQASF